MKAIFYPITMKFETIIKNLIVNYSVLGIDPSFDNVYRQKLTFYRSQRGRRRTKSINKRLRLKKGFDSEIAYAYASNNIVIKHYIEENKSVPLWALFEVISLGNVGNYVACLNREDKEKVADFLNLYNSQYDENVKILEQSIFLIKDLRNAVAQNLKATVKNKLHLEAETNFDILFDYLALLMIFLKESGNSRSELNSYITDFENSVNILYKSTEEIAHNKEPLPYSVYNLIIGERFKLKLNKLKEYIN
ncbi:Abi family protein [Limosilactobacillus vaginalis]|uniref:Abi family protein n=1 Tax=Limosilactobacillus vaginalis TaxID=1633 RepID=UPI003736CB4A